MRETKASVVVTGAGQPGTAAIITTLQRSRYRVLPVDSRAPAPASQPEHRVHVLPPGDEAGFIEELTRLCVRERVRAIVPLVDEELIGVWELASRGIQILSPRLSLVALCLDRLHLMEVLALSGVRTPRTRLASRGAGDLPFPMVLTDRYKGSGRGRAWAAADMETLDGLLFEHRAHLDRMLLQEQVYGPEYTVSVVVWRDGNVQAVVPKEIVLRAGVPHHALTRRHVALAQACTDSARVLAADGPLQVRARLDDHGIPHVFDIAPRFTSTSPLTVSAGVDEVGGLLDQAFALAGPAVNNLWREGVTLPLLPSQDLLTEPLRRTVDPCPRALPHAETSQAAPQWEGSCFGDGRW